MRWVKDIREVKQHWTLQIADFVVLLAEGEEFLLFPKSWVTWEQLLQGSSQSKKGAPL